MMQREKYFGKGIADSQNVCIFAMPKRSNPTTKYISNYAISVPLRGFSLELLRFGEQRGYALFVHILTNCFIAQCQNAKQSASKRMIVPCTPTSSRRNRLILSNPPAQASPASGILEKFSAKFLQEKKFCVLLHSESVLQQVHYIPILPQFAGLLGLCFLSAVLIPNYQRAPLFLYSRFNTFVTYGIS